MPYTQWIDVNPTLKGIRPKLTLAQANMIASWADKIKGEFAWPTAIKQFKKTYTVRGGKWVKRSDVKKENKPMDKQKEVAQTTIDVVEAAPPVTEDYGEPVAFVPSNAMTFKELDDMEVVANQFTEIMEISQKFTRLVDNIIWNAEIADKVTVLKSLFAEYISKLESVGVKEEPAGESMKESLAEDSGIGIQELVEAKPGADENTLMYADVIPIRPGWGNTRDNHYYPKAMLEMCAGKFIGAKMYESDHRDEEKSTRTWVSTIVETKGFTDDGAPIVRVAVHDPNFAERLRNLKAGGILDKMECSILANGTVKAGYSEGDRAGKIVEEITDVISVDYVTRAGAGGAVLDLVESEGGTEMEDKIEKGDTVETPPVENGEPEVTAEVITETEPEPKPLAVEEVMAELGKSDLLAESQLKLLKGTYLDLAAVQTAIEAEKKELLEAYQSGSVTGLGVVAPTQTPDIIKTVSENKDALAEKAFGRK